MRRIEPVGDCAARVSWQAEHSTIDLILNQQVQALARQINQAAYPGIGEALPGYAALLVYYDPVQRSYSALADWLNSLPDADTAPVNPPRVVQIPVAYGGANGPDLAFVAQHANMTPEEVVRIHAAVRYTVLMMGFLPGFPYLGGMDVRLAAPRLTTPRLSVPAGSVGIAGEQTGIYSLESPGGWQIIGRTPLALFDLAADPPFLLAPGDEVQFYAL